MHDFARVGPEPVGLALEEPSPRLVIGENASPEGFHPCLITPSLDWPSCWRGPEWRWGESNPRPLHCERSALPTELHPQMPGTGRREASPTRKAKTSLATGGGVGGNRTRGL
jgi:hypothetical protein